MVDGIAERLVDPAAIESFVAAVNAKYAGGMTVGFQDPEINGTYAVRPERVIAVSGADFTGSPTRWHIPGM